VSASPVEDDGSTGCGDGGADGRRDASTSWSPGGQSVDVVDSGAVLACSDAVLPGGAELCGGDRSRLSPICDNDPRKSTPDVEGPSTGGTTFGMLASTLLRSRSRLPLYTLDVSVKRRKNTVKSTESPLCCYINRTRKKIITYTTLVGRP